MPLDPEAIGSRLLAGRGERSLSEVADSAGVAKSYLAKLERGEVGNPGLATLHAIARVLDLTLAELIDPAVTPLMRKSVGGARSEQKRSLPPSLLEFAATRKRESRPIPDADLESLAQVQFKGKRPQNPDDWYFVYEALKRSTGSA